MLTRPRKVGKFVLSNTNNAAYLTCPDCLQQVRLFGTMGDMASAITSHIDSGPHWNKIIKRKEIMKGII